MPPRRRTTSRSASARSAARAPALTAAAANALLDRAPVVTRLHRPTDLLDLHVLAFGMTLESTRGTPSRHLVAGPDGGLLVVRLGVQHLGEQAFPESLVSPDPVGVVARHRAARGSRLVYEVGAGTAIAYTTSAVLEALTTLRLRVVPLATPGPDRYPEDDDPTGGGGFVIPWQDVLAGGWRGPLTRHVFGAAARAAAASVTPAGGRERRVGDVLLSAASSRVVQGLRHGHRSGTGPASAVDDLIGPPVDLTPTWTGRRPRPRAPEPAETAIEAPYRVVVSPSAEHGAFTHDLVPLTAPLDDDRAQLWTTRLTTRIENDDAAFVRHTDEPTQRVVRAVWTRDLDAADADSTSDPFLQSLYPQHRRAIVRQSAGVHEQRTPQPLRTRRFWLSTLGAWIDWSGAWELYPALGDQQHLYANVESYRHLAGMGRDAYVRVTEPGFLFPFGHRAVWVTVTERKVKDPDDPVAYLRQRYFIVLRELTRGYGGRDTPLRQVTLAPAVTPDLDPPPGNDGGQPDISVPFIPERGGTPFPFEVHAVDQAGQPVTMAEPLVFVAASFLQAQDTAAKRTAAQQQVATAYAQAGPMQADGQRVAFAQSATGGDTSFDTNTLAFAGELDFDALSSRPHLVRANAVVPAMRHLAPQSPGIDLAWAPAYLQVDGDDTAAGFGAANPSQLFLTVASPPVSLDFTGGSDRSGGFLAPNLAVRALSRTLGSVGDDGTAPGGLSEGRFDAATFLDGALPKLFGLIPLVELLDAVVGLDEAPAFVTEVLDAVSGVVTEAERLRAALATGPARLAQDLADATTTGAHAGAVAAIQEAKDALDAAVGPVDTALDDLLAALADLVGDPSNAADAVDRATTVLQRLDDLVDALDHPLLPAAVRASLQAPAAALTALLQHADLAQQLADFADNLLSPDGSVTARFEWNPVINSWPNGPVGDAVFVAKDPRGLRLAAEVRASAQGSPSADVTAELRSFALQLLPGEPMIRMNFSRIGFRASASGKAEVDVVFDGMEFLGALSFIDTLRRMIPFDGFADPPYVDVSPSGVTAGFDLALPNVSVGVFSLENIALGADCRVPFLGDAVTVGFHFCSKDSPFRLTVMCIGGGGWVGMRASPKGLVELEMGLEAGASLSVDLGVASGSVSIMVGVYLRLAAESGLLTGYFRIRGEVDVLGLISASITLELSLTYHFETGKLIGRASLVVEVEVLFFSASVEITCERKLAGSKGDPTLAEIMPPAADGTNDDWSAYCTAFAVEVPA